MWGQEQWWMRPQDLASFHHPHTLPSPSRLTAHRPATNTQATSRCLRTCQSRSSTSGSAASSQVDRSDSRDVGDDAPGQHLMNLSRNLLHFPSHFPPNGHSPQATSRCSRTCQSRSSTSRSARCSQVSGPEICGLTLKYTTRWSTG